MKILYKVCFNESRLNSRPLCNSIQDMVSACLLSVVKQMDINDEIIFFLDGDDPLDTIQTICNKYKINYNIKSFNYGCAVRINKECLLYIINDVTDKDELIYMCDDDYLHYNNCLDNIKDFLTTYPQYFCHPIDYPNLYENKKEYNQFSEIVVTKNWHWRSVKSTTVTFAFTKHMFTKHYSIFTSITESLYWDHYQNLLYVFDKCFSPIPSLTTHIETDCLPYCIDNENIYNNNLKEC